MAVVRSRRSISLSKGCTPAEVGPGAYDLRRDEPSAPAYTAFASTAARGSLVNRAGAELPGPGAYQPQAAPAAPHPTRKGLLDGTAPRFAPSAPGSSLYSESSVVDVPGPGAYTMRGLAENAAARPRPRSHGQQLVAPPRHPPTIPTLRGAEYDPGSQNQQAGRLVLKTGPQAPAPRRRSGSSSKAAAPRRRGPLERSTGRRTVFESSCAMGNDMPPASQPGPGAYDVRSRASGAAPGGGDGSEDRPSAAFASRVPKVADGGAAELADERPGPGSYNLPGMGVSKVRPRARASRPNDSGRTGWLGRTAAPGPGTYGDPRSSFKPYVRKVLTDEVVGFAATGQRECLKQSKPAAGPGPGQYQPQDDLQSSVRRRGGVGRNGIFGSTSRRFIERDFNEIVDEPRPGPGEYGDISPGIVPKRRAFASVFRSTAPRFQERVSRSPEHLVVGVSVAPAVGEYDLPSAFPDPDGNGAAAGAAGAAAFATSAQRFAENNVLGMDTDASPGPQAYAAHRVGSIASSRAARGAKSRLPRERRFKQGSGNFVGKRSTPGEVGPGAYDLTSSFTPKTFNVTMGGLSLGSPNMP